MDARKSLWGNQTAQAFAKRRDLRIFQGFPGDYEVLTAHQGSHHSDQLTPIARLYFQSKNLVLQPLLRESVTQLCFQRMHAFDYPTSVRPYTGNDYSKSKTMHARVCILVFKLISRKKKIARYQMSRLP